MSTSSLGGAKWNVAAISDFNGDAADRHLWRNEDGTLAEWQLKGHQHHFVVYAERRT